VPSRVPGRSSPAATEATKATEAHDLTAHVVASAYY
jgi:hypothetical protein